MFTWFFRLPLLVRIPLLSAVMIFMIAMVVMQVSIYSLSSQYERQAERIGQVYLDGLSAAVLPAYKSRDIAAISQALNQSLGFYLGVVDRQLAIVDRTDGLLAHVAGPNLSAPTPPPDDIFRTSKGYVYEANSRSIWVWRELGDTGIVAANLDLSEFAQERAALRWWLVIISLALSFVATLGGFIAIRRMQQPLKVLNTHLTNAAVFGPQRVNDSEISREDPEAQSLMQAYNFMVDAVQDREVLVDRLARQDRQALLGRIAATLAHEIRNPLTGIMTALQTVRVYGDDPGSRNEALDFVDRGIKSLQGVAEATLNTYRSSAPGPALTVDDLQDVARLVEPHAKRKGVTLQVDTALLATAPINAFKVRQIVLNLLLNAVQTSPRNGIVSYRAIVKDSKLLLSVVDEGPGLPAPVRAFMLSQRAKLDDPSLGVATICRLVAELGGNIEISEGQGRGSAITLAFPLPAGEPTK